MCGIALIISGIRIDLSNLIPEFVSPPPDSPQQEICSIDDIEAALRRRGPDSLGRKNVFIYLKKESSVGVEEDIVSLIEDENVPKRDSMFCMNQQYGGESNGFSYKGFGELSFIGATLQLRGMYPIVQPLVDASGNVLVYNGEIFGGIDISSDSNDTEILMQILGQCSSCIFHDHCRNDVPCQKGQDSVPQLMSRIKGPWALIYWQVTLSVQEPCGLVEIHLEGGAYLFTGQHQRDPRLLLSSVSPISSTRETSGSQGATILLPSEKVLIALREAVTRRTVSNTLYQGASFDYGHEGYVPIAVLFSGGLDSMILAALLDQCLSAKCEIDLLNVSFDGQCAPDRISARAGLQELEKVAPTRRWKLVEINADFQKLSSETKHVMSLIAPSKTYMDLNIGVALWLAAGGEGWVYEESQGCEHVKYKSKARILLVGSGADEQCAGYGRHRTKYRHGSWLVLDEEMRLDMQRLWKRNLGRDDRCIADNGKEARFPFLDEDVIRTLLDIPLWEIADLDQPSGIGDKKILREVAQLLGLSGAAVLPKRAIQFGSRVARESNRKNFGSNRAANQASAGSVEIYGSLHLT